MNLTPSQFLWIATLFEGGLALVAFVLGGLLSVDPVAALRPELTAAFCGVLGSLPLYALFAQSDRLAVGREIRKLLIEKLGGLLAACSVSQLLYIACWAGITEEILFRGLLQPWLEQSWGWLGGLVFSNLIFALVHWITPAYALLAGFSGLYLGLMLDVGPERNLLTPILVHAIYDFLAFIAVAEAWRQQQAA